MERHTIQKDLVYETVCAMHNHPTAQEIYEQLHVVHPTVSRATVYRILSSLAEQNRILRVMLPDGADCFDFNTQPHCHFLCRRCGRIGDVSVDVPVIRIPEPTAHYRIDDCLVLYRGVCGDCLSGKIN